MVAGPSSDCLTCVGVASAEREERGRDSRSRERNADARRDGSRGRDEDERDDEVNYKVAHTQKYPHTPTTHAMHRHPPLNTPANQQTPFVTRGRSIPLCPLSATRWPLLPHVVTCLGGQTIFCGNIDERDQEKDIRRWFERYGTVDRVDMKNRFAFVYMPSRNEAEKAIKALDRT